MFTYFTNQRGSATGIAVIAMMLLAVGGTSYSLATKSNLVNTQSYGQGAAAQKVAEAGINFALAHAKDRKVTIPAVTTDDYMNLLTGTTHNISDANGEESMGTFTITSERNTSIQKGNDYKITSTGTVGDVSRTVIAFISMTDASKDKAPSVFDLINTGRVSTKAGIGNTRIDQKWKLPKDDNTIAKGPSNTDFDQILFADYLYANDENHLDGKGDKGFTLNYNIKLNATTGVNNGYGIYYLASGSGDNMSGYVLQYDPGLTPDQILIRKVIAGEKPYGVNGATAYKEVRPYENDGKVPYKNVITVITTTTITYKNEFKNFSKCTTATTTITQDPPLNRPAIPSTRIIRYGYTTPLPAPDIKVTESEKTISEGSYSEWQAFEKGQTVYNTTDWNVAGELEIKDPTKDPCPDRTAIPLDIVLQKLDQFKPLPKDPDGTLQYHKMTDEHTLTIDVRPDANGNVVHTISIDGLQVLKFVDRGLSKTGPVFTEGCTGLRVWGADVDFMNTTNGEDVPVDAVPPTIRAWGEKNKFITLSAGD